MCGLSTTCLKTCNKQEELYFHASSQIKRCHVFTAHNVDGRLPTENHLQCVQFDNKQLHSITGASNLDHAALAACFKGAAVL